MARLAFFSVLLACLAASQVAASPFQAPYDLPLASRDTSSESNSTAASLDYVCTSDYIQAAFPEDGFDNGLRFDADSIVAIPVTNYTVTSGDNYPSASDKSFCNVTFAYTRDGQNRTTNLWYWFPAPDQFENRFLTTGGGGFLINSGNQSLPGGLVYGSAAGATDGGFGGFTAELTDVVLNANGSINYEDLVSFGYRSIHELSIIGQAMTTNFYNLSSRPYSYYQGCSEGGREGWSQVQRYGDQFDGAAIGAPAFRQGFQQTNHLWAYMAEKLHNYFPSPCELERINNDTIAACDELDGLKDGVVSRTDLCYLQYNVTSSIGNSYYCAATTGAGAYGKRQAAATPAASGNVTAEAAALVNTILKGLHDSQGKRVYLNYQTTSTFDDAATTYNSDTGEYEIPTSGTFGGQWVQYFLNEVKTTDFSFDNVTVDTLRKWMLEGTRKYQATLQTTWPDLEDFTYNQGKIIHYHGESDFSIPTASSVRYYESVKSIMYPDLEGEAADEALQEWYRLYLVPGAGHCAPSATQPNGPFPQTVLGSVIDWVEYGIVPHRLNATVLAGNTSDVHQTICTWPKRPKWTDGEMDCVSDDVALEQFYPALDSVPFPVY